MVELSNPLPDSDPGDMGEGVEERVKVFGEREAVTGRGRRELAFAIAYNVECLLFDDQSDLRACASFRYLVLTHAISLLNYTADVSTSSLQSIS